MVLPMGGASYSTSCLKFADRGRGDTKMVEKPRMGYETASGLVQVIDRRRDLACHWLQCHGDFS
jgi:hypothetical protein